MSRRLSIAPLSEALRPLVRAVHTAAVMPGQPEVLAVPLERSYAALAPLLENAGRLLLEVGPGVLRHGGADVAWDPDAEHGPARQLAQWNVVALEFTASFDRRSHDAIVRMLADDPGASPSAGESLGTWLWRSEIAGLTVVEERRDTEARVQDDAILELTVEFLGRAPLPPQQRWHADVWSRIQKAVERHGDPAELRAQLEAATAQSALHFRLADLLFEAVRAEPRPWRVTPPLQTFLDLVSTMLRAGDFDAASRMVSRLVAVRNAPREARDRELAEAVLTRLATMPVVRAAARALDRRGEWNHGAVEQFLIDLGATVGGITIIAASDAATPLARSLLVTVGLAALTSTPEALAAPCASATDAVAETIFDVLEGAPWSDRPELAQDNVSEAVARGLAHGPTPNARRFAVWLACLRRSRWSQAIVATLLADRSEPVLVAALAAAAIDPHPSLREAVRDAIHRPSLAKARPATMRAAMVAAARVLGVDAISWLLDHVEDQSGARPEALQDAAAVGLGFLIDDPSVQAYLRRAEHSLWPRTRRLAKRITEPGAGVLEELHGLTVRPRSALAKAPAETPRPVLMRARRSAPIAVSTPPRIHALATTRGSTSVPPLLPPEALTPLPDLELGQPELEALILRDVRPLFGGDE